MVTPSTTSFRLISEKMGSRGYKTKKNLENVTKNNQQWVCTVYGFTSCPSSLGAAKSTGIYTVLPSPRLPQGTLFLSDA